MRRYPRNPSYSSYSFGPGPLSPALKALIGANVFLFLAAAVMPGLVTFFGLRPADVVLEGRIWQLATYMFLHGNVGHVLFNMLALWMFGSDLERDWGTRRFLNFYFFCGVGAGLCDVTARLILGDGQIPTIGASGAIYGILLAFGLLYPHRRIYLWFVLPIPARIFALILGAIAFLSAFGGRGSNVAHIAHLGGMVFGYFYLRYKPDFLDIDWMASYRRWRLRRAQRKFEVYMR
jgi:membrane associated rhomboid family serine protease